MNKYYVVYDTKAVAVVEANSEDEAIVLAKGGKDNIDKWEETFENPVVYDEY